MLRNVTHTVGRPLGNPQAGVRRPVSPATKALGFEPLACLLSPLCGMWQPPAPLWRGLIKSAPWPDTLKTSRLGIHLFLFPGIQEPSRGLSASQQRGFLGNMKAVGQPYPRGLGTPTLQPSSLLVSAVLYLQRMTLFPSVRRYSSTLAWLLFPHPSQVHSVNSPASSSPPRDHLPRPPRQSQSHGDISLPMDLGSPKKPQS